MQEAYLVNADLVVRRAITLLDPLWHAAFEAVLGSLSSTSRMRRYSKISRPLAATGFFLFCAAAFQAAMVWADSISRPFRW